MFVTKFNLNIIPCAEPRRGGMIIVECTVLISKVP